MHPQSSYVRRMDRPFPPLLLLLLKGQVGCVWSLCHFLTTVNPAEWATLSFINKIDSVMRVADMLTFVLGSWTLKYALPFCAHPISNSRCVCTTHIPHRKGDLCVTCTLCAACLFGGIPKLGALMLVLLVVEQFSGLSCKECWP